MPVAPYDATGDGVTDKEVGATTTNSGLVNVGATATAILPARATRRRAVLWNGSATVNVAVGKDTGVAVASGFRIPFTAANTPPMLLEVRHTEAIYGITASTATLFFYEEYDA